MIARKRIKIFFVTLSFEPFIQKDLTLLKKHFDVRIEHYTGLKCIPNILKGVIWSDFTFSRFADIHAFFTILFSKIFRKRSLVVVGGYDVARVPEINYGLTLSSIFYHIVKYVLEKADKVLTVDESLRIDAINNVNVSGENIKTVPNGYDPKIWSVKERKENLVITVANIKQENIKRKGLETFVEAAKCLKDVKFVLIGPHTDNSINNLKSLGASNIEFTGSIPNEELPFWYSRAKVYCQLSRYEGLPNSLCEAMLCECVPVGTKYCGIPVAIGDTGFYVPYGDVEATVEAIQKALTSKKGKEARERIKKLFPLENREKELVNIINELTRK